MADSPEDILIQLDAEMCRKHFYHFVRRAWEELFPHDNFADGWHIATICYHIQAAIEGKAYSKHGDVADTLIINVPPGCGKSRLVSVFLSAWLWARDPCVGQWFSSFGYGVLDRDALDARRLIESDWYKIRFWKDVGLTDDQNQKRRFNNTAGGWRLSASIESKTGFGEHPSVLICDDPHDPQQALSDQRLVAIEAWDTKYSTRGIVKGVVKIVIAQRLGEGDLCGHIITNEDDIVHLWIPMEYEENRKCKTDIEYSDIDDPDEDGIPRVKRGWSDPRKEDGELMWPDIMDEKKVSKLKKRLKTAHMISAQLQQNPTSPEGDMFQEKWLSYADAPPTHGVAIRAWDKASTINRGSDFTAGALWVYDGDYFYLCDMRRVKLEMREREKFIMEIAEADAQLFSDYTIVFESSGSGDAKDAAEMQAAKFQDAGFRVRLEKVGNKTKIDRAEPMADAMSSGRVKITKGEWNSKFISELLSFPSGAHDDQVDAAAMGIKKATKSVRFGRINRPLLLLTEEEQRELDAEEHPKTEFEDFLSIIDEEKEPFGLRL